MQTVMSQMAAPRGLPLATQAIAMLGTQRLNEFQPRQQGQQRPVEFPMIDVLHAIGRGDQAQRVAAIVALQEFMRAPSHMRRKFKSQLREMVTVGDFPAGATLQAYIDRWLITGTEMDTGYEDIFAVHDVATAEAQLRRDGFKILDVSSGLAFKKRVAGEAVQFYPISGSDVFVPYDMYGGGISIDRVYWDDQDYLSIGDILTAFRARAYGDRAAAFYGLITGLSNAINFSTGADLAEKINGACADIIRKVFGKGYEVSPSTQFVLMYAAEKAGLVDAALNISSDIATQTAAGKQKVRYKFKRVETPFVPASGSGAGVYVILPKRKLKGGNRMDLTLFGQFNIATYADDISGFLRYGGAVGDTDQVRRIP